MEDSLYFACMKISTRFIFLMVGVRKTIKGGVGE